MNDKVSRISFSFNAVIAGSLRSCFTPSDGCNGCSGAYLVANRDRAAQAL
jgi:hypothetical protein